LEYAPDANIIMRMLGGVTEYAEESVGHLVEQGTTFDVILSINDAGAYGAITAMEAADIPPDSVAIFSVDAESQARQYIREGYYIYSSVQADWQNGAQAALGSAVKLLAGSTIPEIIMASPGEVFTRDQRAPED
jgi:ABC-type sugar transport system substrate-binding protein